MEQASLFTRLGFSVGTTLFDTAPGQRIVLPIRRPRAALLVIGLMALVMTVPAIQVFSDAARSWGELDGLFGLTVALFQSAWLLGWSIGLFILYCLLALLGLGRETLLLHPGAVEVRLGLPFLFLRTRLDPGRIRAPHHAIPEPGSGLAWRGPHLAFEYDGTPLQLGTNLDPAAADRLAGLIGALPAAAAGTRQPGFFLAQPHPGPVDTENAIDTVADMPVVEPVRSSNLPLSTLALIAANLVPLAGVLLFGWDLGTLMVLFWAESGIIGLYHLLKLVVVQRWLALFAGPLFLSHYGAFMAVHFLFIYELFVSQHTTLDSSLTDVGRFLLTLWPALLALMLSHGLSFFLNFIGHGEYRDKDLRTRMREPYDRIMIMHFTVIVGGGLSLLLGNPTAALVLLVALKIATDITAHRRQHAPAPRIWPNMS